MWKRAVIAAVCSAFVAATVGGCALVPKSQRKHLADPTMQAQDDPLEAKANSKLHSSREGASGGNGESAGGGCGCSN